MRKNTCALNHCFSHSFRASMSNREPDKVDFLTGTTEAAVESVKKLHVGKAVRSWGRVVTDTRNRTWKEVDA
ncbi:MAG: hypothetical protein ABT940_09610, partial [Alphaproteobacteria bacterium]